MHVWVVLELYNWKLGAVPIARIVWSNDVNGDLRCMYRNTSFLFSDLLGVGKFFCTPSDLSLV